MTERQQKPKKLTRDQIKKGLDTVPMDTLILGANAGATLTHKQREFARMVALGESKAGAYRKSYNSKGKATTQRSNAHTLAKRTDIAETINAFAEAQRFAEHHTPAQLRAFVIQQLTQHAQNEEFPPAQRLKALELIGRHQEVGSFLDRKVVETIKHSGDIRSRIMEKLQLIGASSTVEANNVQDDTQDADSLLAEIADSPTLDENEQDLTHLTHHPAELGSAMSDDSHTIPHNQRLEDTLPNPDFADDAIFDDVSTLSTQTEPTQSA